MKDRCPNCNRQPVSNALAASISEPASHGSRLDEAWADGWLPGPWGESPLADSTWDKQRSWRNRTGDLSLALSEPQPALPQKGCPDPHGQSFSYPFWVAVPRAQSLGLSTGPNGEPGEAGTRASNTNLTDTLLVPGQEFGRYHPSYPSITNATSDKSFPSQYLSGSRDKT